MKVVIVGAGFAGLKLARKLNGKPGFEVVLVDKFNYHQFQPLFYQVATAGLDASNISFPLRKVFQKSKNTRVRLATLQSIHPSQKYIHTDLEDIAYDVLVLSLGADTNFFGNVQMEEHAFPMKSTTESLQLRNHLLQNFEKAVAIREPEELEKLLNIVVVGGGPTGVEVSGALAEMKKYILPKDYPELDFSKMNIYLLEGGEKTLAAMSERSSAQSRKYLEKLGVKVMTQTMVKDYNGDVVTLSNGESIASNVVIWAAGIRGNVPEGVDHSLVVKGNRVRVDRYCRMLGHDDIYVLGDLAYMETPRYPKGHPQVAPVAMQQADLVANNLRLIERKSNPARQYEFEYRDKGSMATVGRNLAVVDIPKPKMHFGGWFAWLIWMSLHLMLILGVKNRFFVFSNWLYNYFTYDQNLRLIFREFNWKREKEKIVEEPVT